MAILPEEFRSLINARQSIRFFDNARTIPTDVIEAIIDDAQQSPNDCNHQSWKFVVVTDHALKERLVDAAGSCEPAKRASVLIVPLIESGWNHNKFSIIQTLAAATHTLILSAKTRGIESVWMAGIGNVETIRKLLHIPPAYIIDCFVGLGYAKAEQMPWPKAPRQPVKKICSFNRFAFDPDTTYPLKKSTKYDFWKISNQRNPYALWHPRDWTIRQIAFFRGNAVWANSPSPTLHKSRRLSPEFDKEIEFASAHLKVGKTLIMLPYSGAYSAALLKEVPDALITHFELSENHEPIIRKRMKEEGITNEIPFIADDELSIALPDNSFDNVLIFQGLEILPEPSRLIKETERLLKMNGRLFITCRNKWSWFFLKFLWVTKKETVWNFGPYWPLSPTKLRGMLRDKFTRNFLGISPLPRHIGRHVKKWPFNYFSRLIVFIGERTKI